jgi:hypothetical protein
MEMPQDFTAILTETLMNHRQAFLTVYYRMCLVFRRNTLVAGEGKGSPSSISINEYKYTVNIGDQHIRITGEVEDPDCSDTDTVRL